MADNSLKVDVGRFNDGRKLNEIAVLIDITNEFGLTEATTCGKPWAPVGPGYSLCATSIVKTG